MLMINAIMITTNANFPQLPLEREGEIVELFFY